MNEGERAITPPVFVQFDGRRIVAFEDVVSAVHGISDKHAHRIAAPWDADGKRLTVDYRDGPYLTIVPTGLDERENLRRLLIELQQPTLMIDLSRMLFDDLVGHSYERLRLRSNSELLLENSHGCCWFPFG